MSEQIRLGAFLLEAPISSGGMGTVWRAQHEGTGVPAAVKVIAGAYAQDPVYLDGFEREVRAVARMQHPRIIRVYDFGFVDSAAERASGGELPRRSPWLAMELASHGSLAELPLIQDWDTLKAVLFDILDALAHSHARGIVHRDLKPGNVLLTRSSGGVQCKLTDFGIAHVAGGSISTREVFASSAGTPWYMAPEQVESRWRDYGPWTDLYALGCVAYELASGQTPFVGESAVRIARQQLFDRPPLLKARVDAPPSFRAWVERLMVKEVPNRFRRAADAAWALHQISPRTQASIRIVLRGADPTTSGTDTTALLDSGAQYHTEVATLTFLTPTHDAQPPPPPSVPPFSMPSSLLTFSIPPIPEDWRYERERDEALLSGGLGLYRLRATPFIGRERERDIIWNELRKVVKNRETRAIIIRGDAGTGKSRLAMWMAQRAHELGAASQAWAVHSPVGGPADGVAAMFERYLACGHLDFERTYLRLRRLITTETTEPSANGSYFAAALARFIRPTGEAPGVPAVRFTSTEERYQVAKRLSAAIADRRGVVCVLDDVQWGYDAIEYAARLLEMPHPFLIILTVRPDQLAARPLEMEALREFGRREAVTTVDLGPLPRAEHRQLVDELLVLEPTLREHVLERTDGSPLFAAELLGDWVRRRVLRHSPEGFRLDVTEQLPADLYSLWNRRVDRVLDEFTPKENARGAIEVAATLGTVVDEREWREACSLLSITIPDTLLERLDATGIIIRRKTGWSFKHQMLRESIEDAAMAAGRASQQHRVVADLLQFEESADSQLRRALHFLSVGDAVEAAQPLISAVESMLSSGRNPEATAVLAMLEGIFEKIPEGHALRHRVYDTKFLVLRRQDRVGEAAEFVLQLRALAEKHGWQATLAELVRADGIRKLEGGDLDGGRKLIGAAMNHARLSRSPATLAATHHTLGAIAVRFGEGAVARAHFEAARDHFQMASESLGVSQSLGGLAEVARMAGDFATSREHNDEAVRICRQFGFRVLLAVHLAQRGEIAAAEGDYETAHRFYAETMETGRLTNNRIVRDHAQLNLGISLLYLDRLPEGAQHLRAAKGKFEESGNALYAYHAELGLLWLASFSEDTEAWDDRERDLRERSSQDMADRESMLHAMKAGDRWMKAGDAQRAISSFELGLALLPTGFVASYASELRERVERAKAHLEAPK